MSLGWEVASRIRRALAVFVDLFVYYVVWGVAGSLLPVGSSLYILVLLLTVHVVATAYKGLSLGRLLTGIRVGRMKDVLPPGLRAALLRTALVITTGWPGMFVFMISLRNDEDPTRLWWDAAEGGRPAP